MAVKEKISVAKRQHYRGQVIKYDNSASSDTVKLSDLYVGQVKQDKPVEPVSLTSSPQLLPASSGGQHCWPVSRSPVSHATLHQCSQSPAQHEYCSCWSRQEEGCTLWFSGLEGWGSWEGWVCLGAESESPQRRKRTLDRGFPTGSCPCSRWCICGGALLLIQMCLQALWGLTHTREEQEENVWIKGETESYKGQKLYPWLLHILHYNSLISLFQCKERCCKHVI